MHQLTRVEACAIAVRAQLLDVPRPTDLLDVVRRLTLLQYDQTAAVAPNADLVLWSRLGSSYEPAELADAIDNGALVELDGRLRPSEDLALYRAEMAAWAGPEPFGDFRDRSRAWVTANDSFRQDLLARLEAEGPLTSGELPDSSTVPWKSSGWNDDRNVVMMLEQLAQRGEVAVARRRGRDKLWDLAARVYPDDPVVPAEEAQRLRNTLRLRSLGIARARAATSTARRPRRGGSARRCRRRSWTTRSSASRTGSPGCRSTRW